MRPRVLMNMAMSFDGKATSASREPTEFMSLEDRRRMFALRARADALVVGAATALDYDTMGIPDPRLRAVRLRRGQREHPLRVIVSGSLGVSPSAKIFRAPVAPLLLIHSRRASRARRARFARLAHALECGRDEVDVRRLLDLLGAEYRCRTVLCEGGPTLNDAFFRAGRVDELFVTLAPRVVGGRTAPTLVEGRGFPRLAEAPAGELVSCHRGKIEWFLHYRFR
ncbi:MAG: RibD family protein [Verrucomicrobiae bacterium]|nr:RibD family protein [Verrucomicrobiae bacterium]